MGREALKFGIKNNLLRIKLPPYKDCKADASSVGCLSFVQKKG